jgi:hypothetical protein
MGIHYQLGPRAQHLVKSKEWVDGLKAAIDAGTVTKMDDG